jgi:hypothetical protein
MRHLLVAVVLCCATPASAQNLSWDYAQYPAFQQLVEALGAGQRQEAMYVEDKTPVYVLQRFVIDGKSARDWTEALEVLITMRKAEPPTPAKWYARFQAQGAQCPSQWTMIAQDKQSITFQRGSQACDPHPAQTGLYRVVYGKEQVFAMISTHKGALSKQKRAQILAMLATAVEVNDQLN